MIEWIITSSALILLVLVLRLIIKERISPRLRYALWGLVLLRLLIPGTIFESRASVMTSVAAREMQHVQAVPEEYQGFAAPFAPGSNPPLDHIEPEILIPGTMAKPFLDQQQYISPSEPEKAIDWTMILMCVWLAGIIAVGTFLLVVNLKFDRNLKKTRRTLEQYHGLWVFTVDGLTTPCLFGLLHPSIHLTPEVAEDETAKAHVLAHEYTHFRQLDHIWALLRGVCLAVHWYNPLVWLAAVLSRRDCELACDEGAVKLLGEEHRADYGRTLVGLVSRRTTAADLARCATTMTGGKSALKERIALLVKRPRTTAVMAVIVAAACTVFAVCTFTGAAEAEEPADSPAQSDPEPHAEPEPQPAPKPQPQASAVDLPSLDELPTEILDVRTMADLIDSTEPYWLLELLDYEEEIAIYTANPMERYFEKLNGVYLRYGDHLQYFEQQICPYTYVQPEMTWTDFDGDGDDELLVIYATERATTMVVNELVVYEWEGDQWSEHKYDPEVLMEDFNTNAQFESSGGISHISYQGGEVDVALGGEECFFRGSVVTYDLYGIYHVWGPLIRMTLWGEIGPTLTSTNYCFDYTCDISYNADGTFTESGGVFSSFYEPGEPLPALEDLPAEVITDPVRGYNEPIWLMAELPEDDIAVYYEQQTGSTLIRYGEHLERVTEHLDGRNVPELYFKDLDGDEEKELMVIHNSSWGTGTYIDDLVVYEWEAEPGRWVGHVSHVAESVIWDFNTTRTLTVYPEQGHAVVGYDGETLDVDLEKRFGDVSQWAGKRVDCELQKLYYSYSMGDYGLITLTIAGEIRPEGSPPTTCYAFDYICDVYYANGGTSYSPFGYLATDYPLSARVVEGRMTDTFRRTLRSFMRETRELTPEYEDSDFSNNRFAICDVNGDGRDELITQRHTGSSPSLHETVYDQNGYPLLDGHSGCITYYDNGYATVLWYRKPGLSGRGMWPYDLYRPYDSGNRFRYAHVARVDAWDKEIAYTYESFNPDNLGMLTFPEDADKDGDGLVYYIITEKDGYAPDYGTPIDYAEWVEWANAYMGANVIEPTYIRLTEENLALIGLN